MSENQFKNKDEFPTERRIKETIGASSSILREIRRYTLSSVGETKEEWKYYGVKNGWVLKTFYKKRNLFFIGMYDGYFRISFVFGERAVKTAMESEISKTLKKELSEARKYAEGQGLSLQVEDSHHFEDIKKLIDIKVNS